MAVANDDKTINLISRDSNVFFDIFFTMSSLIVLLYFVSHEREWKVLVTIGIHWNTTRIMKYG